MSTFNTSINPGKAIENSQNIGEGDPLHPLATNVFLKEIKRVQVIDIEIKIFEPYDQEITGSKINLNQRML